MVLSYTAGCKIIVPATLAPGGLKNTTYVSNTVQMKSNKPPHFSVRNLLVGVHSDEGMLGAILSFASVFKLHDAVRE